MYKDITVLNLSKFVDTLRAVHAFFDKKTGDHSDMMM
jgi:hypothetical protein